jgi:hypothetical protein
MYLVFRIGFAEHIKLIVIFRLIHFDGMSSMSTNDACILVPYERPVSMWKTLTDGLSVAERDYVKIYLGQSLIEQYEEIEGEVENLLDIWRDYRYLMLHDK